MVMVTGAKDTISHFDNENDDNNAKSESEKFQLDIPALWRGWLWGFGFLLRRSNSPPYYSSHAYSYIMSKFCRVSASV
jgi:hypothetical protein